MAIKKKPVPQEEPKKVRTDRSEEFRGDAEDIDRLLPTLDYHSAWSTPEKFASHIENLSKKEAWQDSGWTSGEDFTGTKDMAEAISLAREGWKEGAEKIERLRGRISAMYPKSPRLVAYGIAGATPNVPRAIAGNLFNMRVHDAAKSRKKPVITLLSEMAANCGVDKNMISNRAAVVAAVIDQIESSGYSCEVISTASSKPGFWSGKKEFTSAVTIRVKESHQPVDVVRMAFPLGHSSIFRRMMFADWGTSKSCQAGLGSGLGSGTVFDEDEHAEYLEEKQIYLIPSAGSGLGKYFKTDELASTDGLALIIQSLKDQGCPAFRDAPEWEEQEKPDADSDVEPDYPDDDDDD